MKVSGFTFIRNAIKFDYPIVEAITSILPVCDEFIVALGNSEDETEELLKSIGSPKIRIIHTIWDDSLREGGKVLAEETNKALSHISADADWAFYIQGDEVVHEKYLPVIRQAMEQYLNSKDIEGLLFRYIHFYGSYDYSGDSRNWYRREVRVIRNLPGIRSYRDAQGFRRDNRQLRVKAIDAWIYHYGWVKPPSVQQDKLLNFNKYWHDDTWIQEKVPPTGEFDYSRIDSLSRFDGTHPAVMQERIQKMNWSFSFDPTKRHFSLKTRLLHAIEKMTGWRIGEYRNYRV
ncbi:MAG: glycosyltransferase family 2 protein [Bacteroidetes bacterium]|nr:glycosyltransferase family 2 protein [Bacteroidota bacterium]